VAQNIVIVVVDGSTYDFDAPESVWSALTIGEKIDVVFDGFGHIKELQL
jgi:hypothetical protein